MNWAFRRIFEYLSFSNGNIGLGDVMGKLLNVEYIHSNELSDDIKNAHNIKDECMVEVAIHNEEPKVEFTPLQTSILRRIRDTIKE